MAVVTVLGVAQDGGRPQPGCVRLCCRDLNSEDIRSPVSLGIKTDEGKTILFEATRDLGRQLRIFGVSEIDHLFITHAHLGHVDGLGLFGRETMSSQNIQLHCSPSMQNLIRTTPAWNQLLQQGVFKFGTFPRIEFDNLIVEFIPVPHRAELSDVHALILRGKRKSVLFMTDHDSWDETLAAHNCSSIRAFLKKFEVDLAFLDATFWSGDELMKRDMKEVPHPTVQESLARLGIRQDSDPEIYFTHLNHTNPLHNEASQEHQTVIEAGWKVAREAQKFTI